MGCWALAASAQPKHKGVCWVGGREVVTATQVQAAKDAGITWLSQTPFGWQDSAHSPLVQSNTGTRVWWGESDEGLMVTTQLARDNGIQTLLKPHLWLRQGWPGDIAMKSEADWTLWFASYEAFILRYATLAERSGIPIFCIGTELQKTTVHEAEWRAIIAKIRKVYSGKLTYAANFHDEFEHIRFWDALDYVGVQAYFSLSSQEAPTLADLREGWRQPLAALEALHKKCRKPVLFTEIGYRSTRDAAREPWRWPQATDHVQQSEQAQADCYETFFQSVWNQKWLAGVYFWKWYPHPGHRHHAVDFTPQQKKAEAVLKKWFSL
jgi:hypothetical protein